MSPSRGAPLSRFNLDLRTPTGVGAMRAFIEGDFAGTNRAFRLRHAYGQWKGLLFGQTWSTFADPEAEPDGIDFEWSPAPRLALVAEYPRWSISSAWSRRGPSESIS